MISDVAVLIVDILDLVPGTLKSNILEPSNYLFLN